MATMTDATGRTAAAGLVDRAHAAQDATLLWEAAIKTQQLQEMLVRLDHWHGHVIRRRVAVGEDRLADAMEKLAALYHELSAAAESLGERARAAPPPPAAPAGQVTVRFGFSIGGHPAREYCYVGPVGEPFRKWLEGVTADPDQRAALAEAFGTARVRGRAQPADEPEAGVRGYEGEAAGAWDWAIGVVGERPGVDWKVDLQGFADAAVATAGKGGPGHGC